MEESASAGGRREAGSLARVRARKLVLGEGEGGVEEEREVVVEVDGSEEGDGLSSEVGGVGDGERDGVDEAGGSVR